MPEPIQQDRPEEPGPGRPWRAPAAGGATESHCRSTGVPVRRQSTQPLPADHVRPSQDSTRRDEVVLPTRQVAVLISPYAESGCPSRPDEGCFERIDVAALTAHIADRLAALPLQYIAGGSWLRFLSRDALEEAFAEEEHAVWLIGYRYARRGEVAWVERSDSGGCWRGQHSQCGAAASAG